MTQNYLSTDNYPSLPNETVAAPPTTQSGGRGVPGIPMRRVFLTAPKDPLLTTETAAGILGIAYETLRKWRTRGKGPAFIRYPNGTIRYKLSVILKFRDDHIVQPQQ